MPEVAHPNTEQLALINQYRPRGSIEYDASEILSIPILASNNLLHQNYAVWQTRSLETMVAQFPGKDLIMDHTWYSSNTGMGFLYDAELWSSDRIPDIELELSPNPDLDRQITSLQGYLRVVLYAAVEASHPIASEIRFRRKSDVSIGGIRQGTEICPLCSIPFSDSNCPHYPPIPELMAFWYGEEEMSNLAPYWIRTGWSDSVELSFVVDGNCPQAKILDTLSI